MGRRARIRGSCFELYYHPSGFSQARLGLVIAKRFAKRAVLRNLIKRQVREVFRCCCSELPPIDIVVRLSKSMRELPVVQGEQKAWVRQEIEKLFQQLT